MKLEIKCDECGKISEPTWHLNQSGIPPIDMKPDICDECMKLGWSEATLEDAEELSLEVRRRQIIKQQKERNE